MITAGDLARMQADLAAIRQDNEIQIVIRRGQTTLAMQPVRLARQGGTGQTQTSAGGQEARARVVVVGGTDFEVQPGDRFNDAAGHLYRVILVRPNRRAAVVAEAELVE